ncbi:MAG TPA: S8 family serine peptidase, partial [Roseimicrobium sp.]|nr:S8 family serine peptidase [Roseimicrobium sp.]
GIVAQAVDTVGAAGVMFFSSAGNENRLSANNSGVWEGDYAFSGTSDSGGEIHKFPNNSTQNPVTVQFSTPLLMQWSDPWGASGNDYDLYTVDSGGNVIGSSTTNQDGNDFPFEGIQINNTGLRAVIRKFSGSPRFLRLNAFRATLGQRTNGETYAHHTANFAFDVAAVDANNRNNRFTTSDQVETFSSDGPRKMFFNANGTAITPGNFLATGGLVRNKPDITAADGVDTTVPGFSQFYGTSAAAPHAAAIAALILEHKPNHTFNSLLGLFEDTSLDIMTPGWDVDSGFGIIMADLAIDEQVKKSYTSLTAAKTTLAVGEVTVGTVKLNVAAPPNGLQFQLTSANSSVTVPATVTIAGGQKQKTFNITGVSNTAGTNVSAKLKPNGPTKTISIVVGGGGGGKPQITSVTLNPASVFGGSTSTGTVTLDKPATANMAVTLTSSALGLATVPSNVTILNGATSATFTVTSKPQVADGTVTITAKKTGNGTANAVLTVKAPKISAVSFNPASVTGGNSSTGTVTLTSPAPTGGITVTLTSATPGRVSVPATIKIVAGATSKNFTATTTAGPAKLVKVTASIPGSSKFKNLQLN